MRASARACGTSGASEPETALRTLRPHRTDGALWASYTDATNGTRAANRTSWARHALTSWPLCARVPSWAGRAGDTLDTRHADASSEALDAVRAGRTRGTLGALGSGRSTRRAGYTGCATWSGRSYSRSEKTVEKREP